MNRIMVFRRSFKTVAQLRELIREATSALSGFTFVVGLGISVLSPAAFAGNSLRLRVGSVDLSRASLTDSFSRLRSESASGDSVLRVIQLARPWREQDLQALRKRGLETLRYLPDDTWVVRGSELELLAAALGLGADTKVAPVSSSWKVDPSLLSQGEKNTTLWVQIYPGILESDEALRNRLGSLAGSGALRGAGRDFYVQGPASLALSLAREEAVEWIQELPVMVSFSMELDPAHSDERPRTLTSDTVLTPPALTGYESGTRVMGFEAAWSRGFDGRGQKVAVADTGCDTGDVNTLHADLKPGFSKGIPIGLGGTSWGDPQGHGTHVMGSVMGRGMASNGAIRGGAHGAELVALGMWSGILDNLAPPSNIDGIVGPAQREGARIHSNSWGNPNSLGEYDAFASRFDEYLWNHPEMLVLFAAGNSGEDRDADGRIDEGSVSSPGTAKNVLTVGASENLLAEGGIQKKLSELRDGQRKWGVAPLKDDKLSDNPNGLAAFSSRGPTRDGRYKPELVAPGTNIVSTRSHHPKATVLWGEYDAEYVYAGGTSMATPLTAGAAAVARQAIVETKNIAQPSGALVKAVLIHHTDDLFPGQFGEGVGQELPTRRPNAHEGFGRVNMDRATNLAKATLVDEVAGVASGGTWSLPVQLRVHTTEAKPFRATLVYTDAPASPSAAVSLVNDLDLQLVNAAGTVVREATDRKNNLEMLEVTDLPPGQYQLLVKGVRVSQGKAGKQPFALVVSR